MSYSYEYYSTDYRILNYESDNTDNIIKKIYCECIENYIAPLFCFALELKDGNKITFNDLFLIKRHVTLDDLNVLTKYIEYFIKLESIDYQIYNHTNMTYIIDNLIKRYDDCYDHYDFKTRRIHLIYDIVDDE